MPPLEISIYGDPVLGEVAAPIEKVTPELRKLAADMADTMYEANGIGLAANQVGVLQRIIVVDVKWARAEEGEKPERTPITMINPEILEESVDDDVYEEGCLSIPGVLGDVWRPVKVKVRYTSLDGKSHTIEAEDLFARCIQHEVDHLNGIMFPERMGRIKRAMLSRQLAQVAKQRGKQAEAS